MIKYIVIYLVMWILTWGAAHAQLQSYGSKSLADQDYRQDLACACFFGLIPLGWIVIFFTTGFYEHGWTLSRRKSS